MDVTIDPEVLEAMRANAEGGEWYAYQNMDMCSSLLGHVQFLKCGPTCTHKTPPSKMADTHHGLGWRYWPVGKVNLAEGRVEPLPKTTNTGGTHGNLSSGLAASRGIHPVPQ